MTSLRMRLGIVAGLAVALAAVAFVAPTIGTAASTTATGNPDSSPADVVLGKALYREFCGECHALSAALAAGFGSNNGLGQYGGPSFNNLRVPFSLNVQAVTEGFAGHEVVVTKLDWTQLYEVSAYIAVATAHNNYLARISDG